MNKFSHEQETLNFDNNNKELVENHNDVQVKEISEEKKESVSDKAESIEVSKNFVSRSKEKLCNLVCDQCCEKAGRFFAGLFIKVNIFDENFRKRFLSTAILAPIVLLVVYYGKLPFVVMMAACAAIAVYEWGSITLSDKKEQIDSKVLFIAVGFSALSVFITGFVGNPAITLWILLSFCFFIFSFNISNQGPNINRFIFGIIYIVFAIEVMVWIRDFAPNGLYHTITLVSMVWASDIFAYLSGKTIGGPKLAPAISPKKTWAGLIGGSIGAGFVGVFLVSPYFVNIMDFDTLGNMGFFGYFFMGAIFSVLGQAGDLLISIVKRHYNVKDSGNIIPGHGGILDRIDALIFVAIIFGMLVVILR